MQERRRYIRINKAAIVRFKIPRNYLGMSSRSEDISEGGLRLAVLQRLEPGMLMELNFYLQETAEPIKAKARVVWQDERKNTYFPFVMGMEFVDITPLDRAKIRDYVNKVSAEIKPIGISDHC